MSSGRGTEGHAGSCEGKDFPQMSLFQAQDVDRP